MFPTTDTFGTVIDEVILSLMGQGLTDDIIVSLTSAITNSDLSITVDDNEVLSRGLIEIDSELVYVSSVAGSTGTIPSWGRGFKGTTAASHSDGAAVHVAPTWPRSIVGREVNNTLRSLYPTLFVPSKTDITLSADTWQYELPAACEKVLSVEWKWGTSQWIKTNSWEVMHSADTTDFPSGKAIAFGDALYTGASVLVKYAARPTVFSSEATAFTASGYPASCKDVVVLGTAYRLLPWADAGRTKVDSAEANALTNSRPIGAATSIAGNLQKMFLRRLEEERRALAANYPSQVHFVR